jgi:hypothetical protein
MKLVLSIVGALVALAGLVFVAQSVASESGEVVTVQSVDASGAPRETRVWVVDHDGAQWLRTGSPQSKWMARLRAHPEIEVTRDGQKRAYLAVPVPEARITVNALMAEKYGWADRFIGLLISRDQAQVVRLDPR